MDTTRFPVGCPQCGKKKFTVTEKQLSDFSLYLTTEAGVDYLCNKDGLKISLICDFKEIGLLNRPHINPVTKQPEQLGSSYRELKLGRI